MFYSYFVKCKLLTKMENNLENFSKHLLQKNCKEYFLKLSPWNCFWFHFAKVQFKKSGRLKKLTQSNQHLKCMNQSWSSYTSIIAESLAFDSNSENIYEKSKVILFIYISDINVSLHTSYNISKCLRLLLLSSADFSNLSPNSENTNAASTCLPGIW